jgi:hypothetical protein
MFNVMASELSGESDAAALPDWSSGREGLWEGVVRKKVRGTQGGQNERDGLD